MKRKGEITQSTINRDWPHQVALPADHVSGRHHPIIHEYCKGLSVATRSHRSSATTSIMSCSAFSERIDAERFLARFDGEWSLPKDRPKWGKPRAGGR